jgi:hypothetical protein
MPPSRVSRPAGIAEKRRPKKSMQQYPGDPMRRRELFKLIGGGAGFCFWTLVAAAQQSTISTIGVLVNDTPAVKYRLPALSPTTGFASAGG